MILKTNAIKSTCLNDRELLTVGKQEEVEIKFVDSVFQLSGTVFMVIGDQSYEIGVHELFSIASGFRTQLVDRDTTRANRANRI